MCTYNIYQINNLLKMSHNPQYLIDLTQTILPKHNAYIKHYFHFKQNRPGGIRLTTKQVI